MIVRFLISNLLVLVTCGCQPLVGGSCQYETHMGIATIIKQQEGHFLARFDAGQNLFSQGSVPLTATMLFPVHQSTFLQIGDHVPAELAIITQGTCTPYQLTLLTTNQNHSSSTFIALSKDGVLTDQSQQKIKEIASLFVKLKREKPEINIQLCGQSQSQGTAEYNFFLSQHYSKEIARLLHDKTVPRARITIIAAGEQGCARNDANLNHNGVCVSFGIAP